MHSILALLGGCLIVFLLYEKIGLTFSCYVAVPIVAPIALCGFYFYNGMGFREVFTRYMRSIFRNKTLVFKSSGYREMVSEIRVKEEAEKRAAVRKAKEERRWMRKQSVMDSLKTVKMSARKNGDERVKKRYKNEISIAIWNILCYTVDIIRKGAVHVLVRSDKAWDYAIGMLKTDGLEPTPEMLEMIEKEKRGEMTKEEIREALDRRYKKETQTERD